MFPLVDLARGFAALTVLVYHLIGHWDWTAFPDSGPLAWFRGGWMAVDLFFVISGFVIGLSAFARIEAGAGSFRAPFLRSRLARIVPLHWLALAVYVAAIEPALWQHADFGADLLAHLLFVHNLFQPYFGSINGPNWSLGTEMQFYLLVALAAPWLARARPWRIALLFVAIAWAWRWGAWLRTLPGPLDVPYWAQTQLPGMLDEFAIGLLLARCVRSARGARLLERLGAEGRLRAACAGAVALAWWALMTVFQAHDYWQEPAMAVFFRTAVATCAGLTLALLCAWPPPRRRWLLAGPLYLGKVSYGIYLWHLPVLFFLGRHTRLEPLVALGVALPATVGLAALTWHLFEQPLLKRLGRAGSGASQPIAAIVGAVQARTPPAAAALHDT
jgi:peptidoglycan/LPS O-acetylase OafA/YrhL